MNKDEYRSAFNANMHCLYDHQYYLDSTIYKTFDNIDIETLQDDIITKGKNDIIAEDSIMKYAFIITFSILDRMIDPSKFENVHNSAYNPYYAKLRISLFRDIDVFRYNLWEKITFSDSIDILQQCYMLLLSHIRAYGYDFRQVVTKKLPKKRVLAYSDQIVWQEISLPAYKWIYRDLRAYIYDQKKPVDHSLYSYRAVYTSSIDEKSTDKEIMFYKRAKKYYDQFDYTLNGEYISDNDMIENERFKGLMNSLKLSLNEQKVLHYRLQHFGNKAIATKMNTSVDNVKSYRKRIANKAQKWIKENKGIDLNENAIIENKRIFDFDTCVNKIVSCLINMDIAIVRTNIKPISKPNIVYRVLKADQWINNVNTDHYGMHKSSINSAIAYFEKYAPLMFLNSVGFYQLDKDSQYAFIILYLEDKLPF